jgi:dedicator of cytokinesis protein 3
VHIRPNSGGADSTLTAAYEKALKVAEESEKDRGKGAWIGVNEMDAVKEEEDELGETRMVTSNGLENGRSEVGDVVDTPEVEAGKRKLANGNSSGKGRPKSLVLNHAPKDKTEENLKDQPPLPGLTAGDSTVAGQQWPLVDEISCAIREWYGVGTKSSLDDRSNTDTNSVCQRI